MLYKFCKKCQQNKGLNIDNYRQCKYSSGKFYFKSTCKKCESSLQIARVKKNGLSLIQKSKMKIYTKQYKKDNKEKINRKYKDKLRSDINFRLRKNVSRAISHVINKNNKSFIKYMSYTIKELKGHLENQFDNKMIWDNYGIYWHIDHIIPQSCLPYTSMSEENFKKCWALENLRPLNAKQNMLDGSTRIRHKMYNNIFNGEF